VAGKHTRHAGWLFLGAVALAYAIAFIAEPSVARAALTAGWDMLQGMLPAVGLIFLLLFLSGLWLSAERVNRHLGSASGVRGWAAALIGGMLSVGPVYAWYATLSELQAKGMRPALAAAFLYSRGIKLPLLPLLIHYFGWDYTLVLVCYLCLFAVVSGWLLERLIGRPAPGP